MFTALRTDPNGPTCIHIQYIEAHSEYLPRNWRELDEVVPLVPNKALELKDVKHFYVGGYFVRKGETKYECGSAHHNNGCAHVDAVRARVEEG